MVGPPFVLVDPHDGGPGGDRPAGLSGYRDSYPSAVAQNPATTEGTAQSTVTLQRVAMPGR